MKESIILEYLNLLSLEIKKERKKQNILGKEAAKLIGVSNSRYSHLESNPKEKVSLIKYIQILEILNVKLSVFLKKVYYVQKNFEEEILLDYDNSYNSNPEKLITQIFTEIKEERKSKGVSQRIVAEKIGIVKRYMSDIESGKSIHISLYRFIEISEALEVPFYVLVERAEKSLIEKDKDNNLK